jgi:hypothetical protein
MGEGNNKSSNTSASDAMAENIPSDFGTSNFDFDPNIPRTTRVVYDTPSKTGGFPGTRKMFITDDRRVNAKNQLEYVNGVAQRQYDEVRDAKNILYSMNEIDRAKFLKDVSLALGGSYTPSKLGLLDKDFGAVGLALRQANGMGRTVDVAIAYMIQNGGGYVGGGGGGGKTVVTSEDDIKPVANELSLALLGRIIEPEKMSKLIKFVQHDEVAYQQASGGMVERPAQLQNVVTKQLMEQNPEEAQMQGTASVAEMIKKALGA